MPTTQRYFVAQTAALLLIGLLALAAIVGATLWLGVQTNASYANVIAARSLRAATVDLLGSLQDVETGQRGYLLTGRDDYLQPYTKALEAVPGQTSRLDQLIAGDPALKDIWAGVKQTNSGKLAEVAQTIALKQSGRADDALAIVNTDKGKQLMDQSRAGLGEMINILDERVASAAASQQASAAALGWVAVIGAIVILGVSGGSAFTALRYTRELGNARDEVAALNTGLEERVAERTADLMQANDEIQRFAYVVTHDLRAPLVNIMGFTSELETSVAQIKAYLEAKGEAGSDLVASEAKQAIEADLPESIGFIRSSTRKMDGLINAILKLAREGGRVMKPETVEIAPVLQNAVANIQHQLTAADGEATVDVSAAPITTDRLALEQIVGNLLDNAVKYRSPKRPLRITLSARPLGRNKIQIDVADNGRGIAAQDHERVFELFRRSGAQDQPGEGIGLAYVRRLVRNLGGDITLSSQLDEGTRFTVILPSSFDPLPRSAIT